jgi:UDP-GlcNAc:undecaprenyl-phosphate GlcNAc-1-phosphate transferase
MDLELGQKLVLEIQLEQHLKCTEEKQGRHEDYIFEMSITSIQYFFLFVFSYSLVGILTPILRKLAISKKILDNPNSAHKSHLNPTPYLGGVAIILGVLVVTYAALIFSGQNSNNFWLATTLLGPALAMGLIGLWDDLKNLQPLPRLISQSIAGILVASLLITTNTMGNPTGSQVFDILITVFWVVGICNSINFFDNLDGGAAGTTAVTALALSFLTIENGQSLIAALSIVVAGSTLGFLIWNKSPARIYMGDAGALFLGFLIATLTIRFDPLTSSSITSFSLPLLLLAIPILDTTVAVISRLRRRISPFQGGKDHLSHRLIRIGINRKLTAIILWALSILFCLFAVILSAGFLENEDLILILTSVFWVTLLLGFLRTKDL